MKVLLMLALVSATSAVHLKDIVYPAKRQQTSPFVAFSAGLNQMQNVTTGNNIVFNDIFLNLGNGYDMTSGVFTAPVDGTYVFIYHGLSETDGQLYMDLYKNNVYEVTAYAHNIGDYASVSNSVVLPLSTGDQVHLQGRGVNHLYGDPAEVYATFSGFILKPSSGGA